MATITTVSKKPEPPASIELWDKQAVLEYFGGTKPLHLSTLYRGMASGIYPRPINVSADVVRWVADECRAATLRMLAARDDPSQLCRPAPDAECRTRPWLLASPEGHLKGHLWLV